MSARWPRLRGRRALAVPLALVLAAVPALALGLGSGAPDEIHFKLFPNPKFAACLSVRGQPAPTVSVTVEREALNDEMHIRLHDFKPNLNFDLFTVQRSNQRADGSPDPAFTNFGLAWYQSDLQTDSTGEGSASIHTILLDQIFGFDPDVNLPPTNTFHVGFWFNSPADAAPCGFTGTTPFNGEHAAGPLAFISRPSPVTGLGPLCSNPTDTKPISCNP
jgi:hypothetical protein